MHTCTTCARGAASSELFDQRLPRAKVKLAAALLMNDQSGKCAALAKRAMAGSPEMAPSIAGLHGACERAHREGLDTSRVRIDIAL